jgi:hypothetical protein
MNNILTIDMITREALRLFINTNNFIRNLDRQYDDSFAQDGAKIGEQLRIRLPNDYTVREGAAASPQATNEQQTTLVVADQRGVDVSFNTRERTMEMDDYAERVVAPMMNNLVSKVAQVIMNASEGGICNYVANVDGSNNILPPNMSTVLNAGALLSDNSAPMLSRQIVSDPWQDANMVALLAGLFNPSGPIGEQYRTGAMKSALGFSWMMDQTAIRHTTGSFSAGTVNGANQTGQTLLVNAITGTLNAGDIIELPNVYAVNRATKATTGMLRQFVITADVGSGATSLSIYPAITPPQTVLGVEYDVQYQTVTASPANGASIDLVPNASTTYRQGFAFAPEAITMATADLMLPAGGIMEGAREQYAGVSMRMITDYIIGTDQALTRTDVLFGQKFLRPEWCAVIAAPIDYS